MLMIPVMKKVMMNLLKNYNHKSNFLNFFQK